MSKKIVFFGDSICVGEHVSIEKTFVSILARKFHDKFPKHTVINSSVNGNTTRQALERIYNDVQKYNPDIVYVQFGINDCMFWATDKGYCRVGKMAFEGNLRDIVYKITAYGCKNIYLATNHQTDKLIEIQATNGKQYTLSHYNALREYNDIIRKVAGDMFLPCIDIEKEITGSNHLLPDEIHLSEEGHLQYAEYIYEQIK